MTVKELKQLLENVDENKEIVIELGYRSTREDLRLRTLGYDGYEYDNIVVITNN